MRILELGVRFEPNLRDGGEPFLLFDSVRKLEEAVQYDVTSSSVRPFSDYGAG